MKAIDSGLYVQKLLLEEKRKNKSLPATAKEQKQIREKPDS